MMIIDEEAQYSFAKLNTTLPLLYIVQLDY